ncbi:hypothetical protein [Bradyrhizobium sp. HKCCYLS20291]|uniref:hypothetical protein n=1 Tax=Bradyrhizobium sp. HKCCYLS20291 TaxID=3420766 RepID=UPI003EBAD912
MNLDDVKFLLFRPTDRITAALQAWESGGVRSRISSEFTIPEPAAVWASGKQLICDVELRGAASRDIRDVGRWRPGLGQLELMCPSLHSVPCDALVEIDGQALTTTSCSFGNPPGLWRSQRCRPW